MRYFEDLQPGDVALGSTFVVQRDEGPPPKLSAMQQRELKRIHQTGEYTISDLGELFSVSRPTVYRTLSRTSP